ncbi:hypothetical protein F2P81_023620 [Scophthalmus maximus]|uniref:Uncharacterized protein n=1 Tax=Scophthalmus maximus TaxID=52904 RepID=A0A6A4RXZ6_SCOMX|nr:hypothetical protein F2P81_023620 [Scophthalmus maximus]
MEIGTDEVSSFLSCHFHKSEGSGGSGFSHQQYADLGAARNRSPSGRGLDYYQKRDGGRAETSPQRR